MARQSNNQNDYYYDPADELSVIYVHMIYDTTKIGIDMVLKLAENSSDEQQRNLVDDPDFLLEGLLIDAGGNGLSLHPLIAVRHTSFRNPVYLTAADREGVMQYFDLEVGAMNAITHWDPMEANSDERYPVMRLTEHSYPPSLAELMSYKKLWIYEPIQKLDTTTMEQDAQVDVVLNGLGIRPETFFGPDREVFMHAMKRGMGLSFLPPNIT